MSHWRAPQKSHFGLWCKKHPAIRGENTAENISGHYKERHIAFLAIGGKEELNREAFEGHQKDGILPRSEERTTAQTFEATINKGHPATQKSITSEETACPPSCCWTARGDREKQRRSCYWGYRDGEAFIISTALVRLKNLRWGESNE